MATIHSFQTGLLLNFSQEKKGGLSLELLIVIDKKEGKTFQRIPLAGNKHLPYMAGVAAPIVAFLKKMTDEALVDQLVKNGFAWLRDAEKPFDHLDDRHYPLLWQWISDRLQEFKPLAPAIPHLYYLPAGESFANKNVRPAAISSFTPTLQFTLEKGEGLIGLRCSVVLNNGVYPLEDFLQVPFFLKSGNEYFLLKKEDHALLQRWGDEWPVVPQQEQASFLTAVVKPLAEVYPVDMDAVIRKEVVDLSPQGRVYVSELNENFLLIKPKWLYADMEMEDGEEDETRVETEDTIFVVLRKRAEERELVEAIRALHGKFSGQGNGYFYLNFKEALEKSWFLNFYNKMQQLDIPVLGMNRLRKFKYNTYTPRFEIIAGKGIDWFDLTIRVSYGEQVVPLHELRKAILGKQDYILLGDGSLGMLPKEWIEKYGLLMRMGQMKEGGMKLLNIHWTLLEGLGASSSDGIPGSDESLQKELEEKKERLKTIATAKEWRVSSAVQAKLRDYQLGGFQWMCLLDEMVWGGCLADDMGLGKTLQTLSFLQHLVESYPEETHLVVCPTSLLYNWEGELKKFVPGLAYHIHYGADREFDEAAFRQAHVIITSYGMVRSDILHFSRWKFGYVILDESQAIKNPASQVRKAVQLLQGRNRLALSGTPVQNNTFDLFAQMDFLNPGMLGSADFFRTEFATPIDKNGDKEAAARLRKLVYPFILRRTKEQVAGDLPDKTEMILWCEMGAEQRKIYDSFKEHYRESILERISEEGVGKSSIYILEGLTKLRQICDSPAILREEGKEPYPNVSTKLEELIREIEENTSNHKSLVFSQFTSMLGLIREALQAKGIPYLYLDGSMPAEARKKSVQQFQEDDATRVFLISLKAGGVGLTLTAADYVYLVDPWWNPAAEQQAIDRSHRIGQVKKVFAYRMICKDTVEEKILQLQEKKRSLAADLVADESGFVKKLTQEDVAYLFS
ncbi:MAG TPA: DEAD/DEAH box helicase [Puia sp.]|nr:DEAD/DEAH box helicase [Puia sp.]